METTKYIWMDGKLVLWEEANTHILTHTLHYGGGAFEGIRAYKTDRGAAIFRLEEHIDRLYYSSEKIGMKLPFTREELISATINLLKENKVEHCYIRPLAYYGYGVMGLNPSKAPINVSIICWPWGKYLSEDMISMKTSRYIRIHPGSTYSDAKICGHYVNSILASLEVKNEGYGEGLFLDYNGNVAEGPGENIFIVKDETLYTPKQGTILMGITRQTIMQLANDFGYETVEKDLKVNDVYNADEVFLTGTAAEVTGVKSLDDKVISKKEGKITARLKESYHSLVRGNNERYLKYLTFVS